MFRQKLAVSGEIQPIFLFVLTIAEHKQVFMLQGKWELGDAINFGRERSAWQTQLVFLGSDLLWAVRGWLWGDAGREGAEQPAPQEQVSAPAEYLQVGTLCSLAKSSEWDCRLKANTSEQRGTNSGRLKLHKLPSLGS